MKIGILIQPWNTDYPPNRIGSSISIIAYELAKRLALTNDVTIYGKMASHQQKETVDEFGVHFRSILNSLDSWLKKNSKTCKSLFTLPKSQTSLFCFLFLLSGICDSSWDTSTTNELQYRTYIQLFAVCPHYSSAGASGENSSTHAV